MNNKNVIAGMTATVNKLIATEPDFELISQSPFEFKYKGNLHRVEFTDEPNLITMDTINVAMDEYLTYEIQPDGSGNPLVFISLDFASIVNAKLGGVSSYNYSPAMFIAPYYDTLKRLPKVAEGKGT